MRDTLFGRLFLIAMSIPATRRLLERRVLPKSGEGPSKEVRETGSYEIVQVGEMPDGTILKARITGQGDPGVRSTTLMLTEAALCLAEDESKIAVGGGSPGVCDGHVVAGPDNDACGAVLRTDRRPASLTKLILRRRGTVQKSPRVILRSPRDLLDARQGGRTSQLVA